MLFVDEINRICESHQPQAMGNVKPAGFECFCIKRWKKLVGYSSAWYLPPTALTILERYPSSGLLHPILRLFFSSKWPRWQQRWRSIWNPTSHQPDFFCYFVSTGVALRQYLPCHPYAAKKRSRPTLWRELWRPCRILQLSFLSRWWFPIRFYCYPYILGERIQFDAHICLRWVVQPPT